jgi:hypothetical protein
VREDAAAHVVRRPATPVRIVDVSTPARSGEQRGCTREPWRADRLRRGRPACRRLVAAHRRFHALRAGERRRGRRIVL